MPRARDPNRDKAFQIWKEHNGTITNRALGEMLDVPEKTISAWKSRDKWNVVLQTNECSTTKQGSINPKRKNEKKQKQMEVFVESDNLTEKQRLFCIYYVKSFNATQSAIKAGYSAESAHAEGSRLLRNVKVADEIRRIKGEMRKGIFIDAMDVLDKWIKIAFADITDYTTFGKREVPLIGAFGPIEDEDGSPLTHEVNYVDFKESTHVDGTIITEVKQGKDGVSVKLADKMRALEMLTKYFDILPDTEKRRLQEEKLKMELSSMRGDTEGDAHQQANSYLEALNASVDDVFGEDEGESDGDET